MANQKTYQFTTLNSIRVQLTRKTEVFAQILDINGRLYIGLQRTSYQKNAQGLEEPRQKSIFLPFTAWKHLASNVSPTLVQQVEHLEEQRKTLALKQEESATAPAEKRKKANPYPNNGTVRNH